MYFILFSVLRFHNKKKLCEFFLDHKSVFYFYLGKRKNSVVASKIFKALEFNSSISPLRIIALLVCIKTIIPYSIFDSIDF